MCFIPTRKSYNGQTAFSVLKILPIDAAFKPFLVVNMVEEGVNAGAVVHRIQKVAEKMLSIQVTRLGSVPYAAEVKNSALDLVPLAAKYPQGDFSSAIGKICEGVLMPGADSSSH